MVARKLALNGFLGINKLRAQAMKAASRIAINIHEQGGAAIARLDIMRYPWSLEPAQNVYRAGRNRPARADAETEGGIR